MNPLFKNFIVITSLLILSACGTMPMNAQEYRDLTGSYGQKKETEVIKRSFSKVAPALAERFKECLTGAVRWQEQSATHSAGGTITYTPTVIRKTNSMELHLQKHNTFGVKVHEEPEGGPYYYVADLARINSRETQITNYRNKLFGIDSVKPVHDIVLGWAKGTQRGCPDLTKL